MAFRLGTPPKDVIAVASLRDGRILKRLSLKAADIRSLALSPDGQTLYYASGGAIWSVPVDESAPPRRVVEGDDAAIDPAGRYLYVKELARQPIALIRVPVEGGAGEPIPIPASLRLTNDPISPSAVDSQGRVLLEVATSDSFFYGTAVYDPARQSVTRVPVKFEGDVWTPGWTSNGRIAAEGARYASTVWRYHR
jgi:hypothetical protein